MKIDDFSRLFSDLCAAHLTDRQRRIDLSIKTINARDAAQGTGRSGAHYKRIFSALETELANRTNEIRADVQRTCNTLNVDIQESLGAMLKSMTGEKITETVLELKTIFENEVPADLARHFQFDVIHAEISAKNDVEIEFYVASLKKTAMESSRVNNTFFGPVGAIQSGSVSVAIITQTTTNPTLEKIAAALEEISQEIRNTSTLDEAVRDEILDLVKDGAHTLSAEKPNRFKVAGFLSGLKNVVDIVPKIKATYEVVASTIQTLGF